MGLRPKHWDLRMAKINKTKHSFIAGGTANWWRPSGYQCKDFIESSKINLPYEPVISLFGICPKDSTSYSTDNYSTMFTAAVLEYLENGDNLYVLQPMNG